MNKENVTFLELLNDILLFINSFDDYCYLSNIINYSLEHDDCWKDVLDNDDYVKELGNYLFCFNKNIFLNKTRCFRCEFYGRPGDAPISVEKDCMWESHGKDYKPCESR